MNLCGFAENNYIMIILFVLLKKYNIKSNLRNKIVFSPPYRGEREWYELGLVTVMVVELRSLLRL